MQTTKSADQPGHTHRLISAFVICFMESILAPYPKSFIFLASNCSCLDLFESNFVGNPEDRFSCIETHIKPSYKRNASELSSAELSSAAFKRLHH